MSGVWHIEMWECIVERICMEEGVVVNVKYVTGRYDIETGKSNAEIPTPRG